MKLTQRLLDQAMHAARRHAILQAKLTKAFMARYGVTYSNVNADQIIDALDYGRGPRITLKECDDYYGRLRLPAKSFGAATRRIDHEEAKSRQGALDLAEGV